MAHSITLSALFVLSFLACNVHGQLSSTYYANTCKNLSSVVAEEMKKAVRADRRMGASILRLHFHDCFVNGCDGSVLLLDGQDKETDAPQNLNSLLGFSVIDAIKSKVEAACRNTVSCADILALAARDGVVELGGPTWTVQLGRRDSRRSSRADAAQNLPLAGSSLAFLKSLFSSKGLNAQDLTALSGAHSVGFGRCVNFRPHIYNDRNIDPSFARLRQGGCPRSAPNGNANLAPLDSTFLTFDNKYFDDLTLMKGLFHSDQELFNNGTQDSLVRTYRASQSTFFSHFATAMIKMGNISPLTGNNGEIRLNCRRPN